MIGPALAGLLIASVGTGWAFLLNGASFIAVLASLFLLRVSGLHANARAHRTKGSLTEGLRYVWSRPDLKAILIMLFLIGTFGLNFPIFISTMAVSVFHTDARGYGLLSSIMAIGSVSGALLAAGRDRPRIMSLLTGAASFGLGCMMQLTTESAMRGRVMALRVAIALGGTPIGAPVVGWVSDHLGPRWALGVGAASGFAAATVAIYAMTQQIHRPRRGAFEPHDLQ
jgi:MFS family permease